MRIDEFYYKQPEPRFVDWLNSPLHEASPELFERVIPNKKVIKTYFYFYNILK